MSLTFAYLARVCTCVTNLTVMAAMLRSTMFLHYKVPTREKVHEYFKNVGARHWQLKHYLSFRLKTDEQLLPWNTVYNDWQQSLVFIFKNYTKSVSNSISKVPNESIRF